MKKLALGIATLLFAATPAFACPDMESGGHEKDTIKTADKDKKNDKAKDAKGQTQEKAKPKADDKTAKPAPKKEEPKKDKVSQK
jgi:hypothetical protein